MDWGSSGVAASGPTSPKFIPDSKSLWVTNSVLMGAPHGVSLAPGFVREVKCYRRKSGTSMAGLSVQRDENPMDQIR